MTTRLAVAFGNAVGRVGLLLFDALNAAEDLRNSIRGKLRNR